MAEADRAADEEERDEGLATDDADRPDEGMLGALRRDVWMLVLAVASLGVVGWVEVRDLSWPEPQFQVLAAIDLAIVLIFLAEFGARLRKSEDKRLFWRQNWYDLLGMVPLYVEALAWMRAARLLRVLRIVRLLRAIQVIRRLKRSFGLFRRILRASRLAYTMLISFGVVVSMAVVVWMLERDTNPNFGALDDALWWAVVTATTVGYGDITPETGVARVIAGVLMLFGIGLIGVVATSLSAAVLSAVGAEQEEEVKKRALPRQLEVLAGLHERGALTDQEFAIAKKKVLERAPDH